ncbi:15206_t:CDS:2, partial [Dentiscutata heterogama]
YLLDTALRLRPFFIMVAMVAMLPTIPSIPTKDANQREGERAETGKILTVGAGISKIDSVAGTRISELADAGSSGTEGVSESERHHQDEGMRSRGLDEGVISSLMKSRNPPTQRAY